MVQDELFVVCNLVRNHQDCLFSVCLSFQLLDKSVLDRNVLILLEIWLKSTKGVFKSPSRIGTHSRFALHMFNCILLTVVRQKLLIHTVKLINLRVYQQSRLSQLTFCLKQPQRPSQQTSQKNQNGLVAIMPVNYDYYFNNRVICSPAGGGLCSLIDSGTTPPTCPHPCGITCELANTPVAMLVGLLLVVSTLTARSLAMEATPCGQRPESIPWG